MKPVGHDLRREGKANVIGIPGLRSIIQSTMRAVNAQDEEPDAYDVSKGDVLAYFDEYGFCMKNSKSDSSMQTYYTFLSSEVNWYGSRSDRESDKFVILDRESLRGGSPQSRRGDLDRSLRAERMRVSDWGQIVKKETLRPCPMDLRPNCNIDLHCLAYGYQRFANVRGGDEGAIIAALDKSIKIAEDNSKACARTEIPCPGKGKSAPGKNADGSEEKWCPFNKPYQYTWLMYYALFQKRDGANRYSGFAVALSQFAINCKDRDTKPVDDRMPPDDVDGGGGTPTEPGNGEFPPVRGGGTPTVPGNRE